ncbi:MAG: FAD binding domain-containing protein [Spirochaetota bacterium]|nr:FAD binding domain-containing protein [Spirochaetota bacterium]
MLRKDLRWFFPEKPDEIPAILKNEAKAAFHAGGTSILRTKPESITALIDLGGLGWNTIRADGSAVVIGAMATFNDVIKSTASKAATFRMLQAALARAASNSVRNRITIGGSLADYAPWSDLIAPLVALEADVVYLEDGKGEKKVSVTDFIGKKLAKEKNCIREVRIPEKEIVFAVKRLARTAFEYGMFSLAVCGKYSGGAFESVAIALSGTKDRYARLAEAEKVLTGKPLSDALAREAADTIKVEFAPDVNFGAEYKANMVGVYLRDALAEIAGRK